MKKTDLWEKVITTTEFIQKELDSIEEKKKQVNDISDTLSAEVEKIIEKFKKDYMKKMEDHETYLENVEKSLDPNINATNLEEIMQKAKEIEKVKKKKKKN